MECTFDPGTDTLLRCTRCARPACPQCLTEAPVGQQCPACVEGLAPEAVLDAADLRRLRRDRARRSGRAAAARTASKRPGWVFWTLVTAFVASVAVPMVRPPDLESGVARLEAVVIVILGALVSVTLHEWGHAIVAYLGGDRSVVSQGYLTLDFRRYAHPVLSLGLPLLFLLAGGLPLPGGAVWIDRSALRSRWWSSAVSAAGPLMNILFAVLLMGVAATPLFDGSPVAGSAVAFLAWVLVVIAILNALPIPGLDGYGMLEPHLPAGVRQALAPVQGFGIMVVLLLAWNSSALDFMYRWALSLTTFLGVDPALLGLGLWLANPQLG